jgi:hypothetical protein
VPFGYAQDKLVTEVKWMCYYSQTNFHPIIGLEYSIREELPETGKWIVAENQLVSFQKGHILLLALRLPYKNCTFNYPIPVESTNPIYSFEQPENNKSKLTHNISG